MNKFCSHCKGKTMDEDRECQGCGHPVVELKPRKGTLIGVRGGKGKYLEPIFSSSVADAWVEPRDLFDISKSARGHNWYDDVIGIKISSGDFQMMEGDEIKLPAKAIRAIHSDSSESTPPLGYICWDTSNSDILLIQDGKIIAVEKGTALLWAKIWDKKEIDACVEVVIE